MQTQSRFLAPGAFLKHLNSEGLPSHKAPLRTEDFEIFSVDLTSLKIDGGIFTEFIVPLELSGYKSVAAEQLINIVPKLRKLCSSSTANFSLLAIGGRLTGVTPQLLTLCKDISIAIIDREVMEAVYERKSTEHKWVELCRGFVRFLGHEVLSPYKVGEPAWGGRFFGRTRLLEKTLAGRHGRSFILIGKRRIGKTSLLREIRHRLFLRDREKLKLASVDASVFSSTDAFLEVILTELGYSYERSRERERPIRETFPTILHELTDRGWRIAVFVDEVDKILDLDEVQGWELLNVLRAAFQHESCRIFLAGFRRLRAAVERTDNPLHNIGEPIEIRRLTRDETLDMINRPLRRLGVDLIGSELPMGIYKETGGQPELIQIFCSTVVEEFARVQAVPDATELIGKVLESTLYEERVIKTFLANASPYEALACYLLIARAQEGGEVVEETEFGLEEIRSAMNGRGVTFSLDELVTLVDNLELSGTIEALEGSPNRRYRFAVPQLARTCLTLDLDLCIVTALEAAERARGPENALRGETEGKLWVTRRS
jgi:hypothetical protein